jgi:two-component system, chemotaxis family, chemotaxis protein CheY
MDGLEALRRIQAIKRDAAVVIISSVGGVAEKVDAALQAGARSVITKPFDPTRVLEVLDSVH